VGKKNFSMLLDDNVMFLTSEWFSHRGLVSFGSCVQAPCTRRAACARPAPRRCKGGLEARCRGPRQGMSWHAGQARPRCARRRQACRTRDRSRLPRKEARRLPAVHQALASAQRGIEALLAPCYLCLEVISEPSAPGTAASAPGLPAFWGALIFNCFLRTYSPIKKVVDERKGPKNNKRKWGDASFVQAARVHELQKGHHGTPVYSHEIISSESPALARAGEPRQAEARQPLRLLAKCKVSIHADLCKSFPALKRLPAQGLTLAVYQLARAGPAAYLPSEVVISRVQSAVVLKTNEILPTVRPLMCVVADAESGGKNSQGFEVLENFLASQDQLGLVALRSVETPACHNNQTSTFKRECEEVLLLHSSTSVLGREFLGDIDEKFAIAPKHLRAAFVHVSTMGKGPDAINAINL
jgi:hypothetical protein